MKSLIAGALALIGSVSYAQDIQWLREAQALADQKQLLEERVTNPLAQPLDLASRSARHVETMEVYPLQNNGNGFHIPQKMIYCTYYLTPHHPEFPDSLFLREEFYDINKDNVADKTRIHYPLSDLTFIIYDSNYDHKNDSVQIISGGHRETLRYPITDFRLY